MSRDAEDRDAAADGREVGTVRWFNDTRGYGFIKRSEGADVFVHHTAIRQAGFRSLAEGERVEFSVVQGPRGLQASDVVRLSPAESPWAAG